MPVEDNIIRNTYGDEKYKVEEKVGKSDSIGKPLNRLQHKTEKVRRIFQILGIILRNNSDY